jgi:ketosteroid isomerase-like protein
MMFSSTKNTLCSLGLISVAIATLQPAYAENKAALLPIIQGNYNQINAAFIRKDVKGATAYFTPDYVSINKKGEKQNLEEFRSHYNTILNRFNIKLTSNKASIKDISVDASGGINVSLGQHTEGTMIGGNKIVIDQSSKDLWTKTAQGWRLKQSKILTSQTKFNGKVFND